MSGEEEGTVSSLGISACLGVFLLPFWFSFAQQLLIMLGASQGLDSKEELGESSPGTSLPFPFMDLAPQRSCVQLCFCTAPHVQPARHPDVFPAGLPRRCAVVVRKLGFYVS